MADSSHHAGRPPAADEKTEEMGGPKKTDFGLGKADLESRDRIKRTDAATTQLQQDDRQEQGREGDQKAHLGAQFSASPSLCLGFPCRSKP